MANCTDQFNSNLKLVQGGHQVDRIGLGIAIKGIGKLKFKLEDGDRQVYTIRVPNYLYVPSLKRVLLAPHHWTQEAQDKAPNPRGTWMATYGNCIILLESGQGQADNQDEQEQQHPNDLNGVRYQEVSGVLSNN